MTDLRHVARRGLRFGLPTIDLYKILRDFALDPAAPEHKAPLNALAHTRRLADASDRTIVAPNVDTPYSYAWLDLRAEPMVLKMPAFGADRYVAAQLIDLYTYIVGYVSPRTTGSDGAEVLIAGPRWDGEVPDGLERLDCLTDLCLVLIRTQLFDEADLPNVTALQDAMAVRPLSAVTGGPVPLAPAPLVPIDAVDVRGAPDPQAFAVLSWMLRLMPTLPEDAQLRAALARELGVGAPAPAALDVQQLAAVAAGMGDALAEIGAHARTIRSSGELFGSREFFAGDDLQRATGAFLGILGNAAEEYLGVGYQTDAAGGAFDGTRTRYTVTFPADGLPPVDAFWSITVYDADRFLYANELDRSVLGSRQLATMARDPDGGVTIEVAHARPAEDRLANWLPCPAGPFVLTFRTYLPGEAIRDGAWTAPPLAPHQVHA
jgi:hypothetical protein